MSPAVAVIIAQPPFIAEARPSLLTLTTFGLLDVQVTVLFVALEGITVAVRVAVWPSVRLSSVLSSVILVTGMVAAITDISQAATRPPSFVVADIVTDPILLAETLPLASTLAIEALVEAQEIDLSEALSGKIVAINVSVSPTVSVSDDLFREIEDT